MAFFVVKENEKKGFSTTAITNPISSHSSVSEYSYNSGGWIGGTYVSIQFKFAE